MVPTTTDAPLRRPASFAQAFDRTAIFARQGPAGGFGTLTPGVGETPGGSPGGVLRKIRERRAVPCDPGVG